MNRYHLIATFIVLIILLASFTYAREYSSQEMYAIIDGFHVEALRLKHQGRYEEARSIFEKILRAEPNNSNATIDLGNVYLSEKRYKEALTYYKKAGNIGLDTGFDYGYYFNSAIAYAGAGYNKAAIHCLKRCISIRTDHKDASNLLILVEEAYKNGHKLKVGPIGDRFL